MDSAWATLKIIDDVSIAKMRIDVVSIPFWFRCSLNISSPFESLLFYEYLPND
ncbi:hypothetical protein C7S13_7721 [Burkholderia cepacia]|nr:hypothetical protein [Burkholderia cepacia]